MTSFKEALDQDLRRAGLDRKALAEALKISVQAVGKWVATSSVPPARRQEIAALLGADALVLKDDLALHVESKPRRIATPIRDNHAAMNREVHDRLHLAALLGAKSAGRVDKVIRFGASSRRFDYLSNRICVEIVRCMDYSFREMNGPPWTRIPVAARLALLSLALLNELLPNDENASIERSVVLLTDGRPVSPQELSRFTAEAAVLGVSVVQLNSMRETAQYIEQLEKSQELKITSSSDDLALSSDSAEDWSDTE